MPRRLAILVSLLATATTLAACGNKQEVVLAGETEGVYLDVGEPPLKYQVQISRQLNPADTEDRAYLLGLPPAQRELAPGDIWFGVFIRVENDGEGAQPTAKDFTITDTEDNEYRPIPLRSENVYAYRPQSLAPGRRIPELNSTAEQGSIQGSLLLYRIPVSNLENRPLEFSVKSPQVPQREGTVDLDV
jgi:hypothetical protein